MIAKSAQRTVQPRLFRDTPSSHAPSTCAGHVSAGRSLSLHAAPQNRQMAWTAGNCQGSTAGSQHPLLLDLDLVSDRPIRCLQTAQTRQAASKAAQQAAVEHGLAIPVPVQRRESHSRPRTRQVLVDHDDDPEDPSPLSQLLLRLHQRQQVGAATDDAEGCICGVCRG